MWGPDLTIRAPYITHTLEGGMEERGLEGSEHTHAYAPRHTRGQFEHTLENAGTHRAAQRREYAAWRVHTD